MKDVEICGGVDGKAADTTHHYCSVIQLGCIMLLLPSCQKQILQKLSISLCDNGVWCRRLYRRHTTTDLYILLYSLLVQCYHSSTNSYLQTLTYKLLLTNSYLHSLMLQVVLSLPSYNLIITTITIITIITTSSTITTISTSNNKIGLLSLNIIPTRL